MKKIVIDIYGADAGSGTVVAGVAKAMHQGLNFYPILVGDPDIITDTLTDAGISPDRYEVIGTTDYIEINEPPMVVFNSRETSSMVMAYARLASDDICTAMLSPGNTGALLVGSICKLGLASGIKFPALASALPCSGDKLLCLVDCGANVSCNADDLANFARMGNVFCKCFCGVESPRVGIMSVGREKGKGDKLTVAAYERIASLNLNFVGNLEGSDMVSDYADVVVTDGFSGNLLLKCTEASGKAALAAIENLGLDEETMNKIRQVIIKKFDFNSRGAATFLGTKKTVVKMHGCANEDTVVASIDQIIRLEAADFSAHIAAEMSK